MIKTLQQGAEAIIYLDKNKIKKERVKKSYRHPELDEKLRKLRTRSESRIIDKLSKIINVPKIIDVNEDNKLIIMEFVNGKKLSDDLEKLDWKEICKQIGGVVSKLHDKEIVHGDLTTSNMIYVESNLSNVDNTKQDKKSRLNDGKREQSSKGQLLKSKNLVINNINDKCGVGKVLGGIGKVYLIDFGLGFHSSKIEDKAVDLHLLKQALNAKHFKIADESVRIILDNYKPSRYKEILEQLKKVESRGRYKERC